MPGAKGALQRWLLQKEVVFRTAPAPAAKVMPFTTYGVERDPRRQENPTITSSPLPAKTDEGDPIVAGPFTSIFDLRSIGNLLQLLLGAPITGKAVTVQPVNVTGVTIHSASADCAAGNGTLTFTAAGTTATWTPQGGTAGAPVNIGAGGDFTLLGGGGGQSISITVVAAALPVGNQNDANLNVSGTLKAHAFPVNGVDRPSALSEIQNPDIAKFYRSLGCKLNELSWDPLANDQNLSGSFIAALEVDPVPVAAFDGAPTSYAYVRACSAKGKIWDGNGVTLGTIVGASAAANNNMTGYACADGLPGYGYIDQGDLVLSGTLRSVFDGASAYAMARAGTSTRLRIEHGAPVGADLFALNLDLPDVELTEKGPERTGKSGLYTTNNWRVHAGATLPKITLVNDVAAY